MKIFITGVAGFLGSHLADRMLDNGYEVVGVDNLVGGDLENINKEVKFIKDDCENIDSMVTYMKGSDVVFHAACTAHDGLSVFSPFYITKNTFQITMSVLSAAIQNKVKRFIYCSSMSRYGEQDKIPFTEDMICKPNVPYGVAKYSSETIVRQLCEFYGIEYVIVVPHNIIGPRQKFTDPFRNVAGIMINRIINNKQPIIYGDGTNQRCFSFINDVVDCLEKIIIQANINKEIINVGPDEEIITISELAKVIADLLNFNLNPIYVNERPLEIKFAYCSSDKARRLLNYSTKTSLKEGLESMINYVLKKGASEFNYNYKIEIINEKTPITWTKKMF